VKKVQRNFAVEYKSGRRKIDAKPNSIWGSLDLKSVARDVEQSTMPFPSDNPLVDISDMEASPPEVNRIPLILTSAVATSETAADAQEMVMADDIDTITNANAPAVVETSTEPKKQRKPRTKKVSPETGAMDEAIETGPRLDSVGGQKKRGRKGKAAEGAAVAKRSYVKRPPKDEQPEAGVAMADLLQLEEENQKLRKLLAEKLRTENADLRNKLNLG
jgi:hypothetical protein